MRHVPPQTADVRMVDVGEVRLRTSVRGSGPPLLLITGLGACLELVAPFERRLSVRKLQVISFDAPGIGGSTPYPRPRRLPAHVRTITGLLDALGHDQVDVLGATLGGAVAQQWLGRRPTGSEGSRSRPPSRPRWRARSPWRWCPWRCHAATAIRPTTGRTPAVSTGPDPAGPGAVRHATVGRFQPPSVKGYLGQLYAVSGWRACRGSYLAAAHTGPGWR